MVLVCCVGINLFSYTKPSTRFPPTQTNISRRLHRRPFAFASVITTTTSLTLSSTTLPPLSPISSFSMETGPYEDALNRLSSLITRRVRGDGANRGDQFDLMSRYVQILELEEPISKLKVIHVAGTKGKGSTCSFSESILRNCGFRTGLFTSPHLIDVRERFRLDGVEISEDKFLEYFWWCWNRLEEKTDDKVHMPAYFRFLALLAFKIFTSEQVDVAILEVGLGGKYDATNMVQAPVVCGISSLGYDHMEILGNTLAEIAGEKAGIFKKTVPAYTVCQPEEAMRILEDKASQLGIPLVVAPPLNVSLLNSQKLGLDGEHQYVNAGLAICLCRTWLEKTGCKDRLHFDDNSTLPEQFIRGLATTTIAGRAQIVEDPHISMQYQGKHNFGGLAFYLDGAHSPESMEMCARWFCHAAKKDIEQLSQLDDQKDSDTTKHILLFNCMPVRDPQLLLPRLVDVCADKGIYFHKAIFVPNLSVYHKVGSYASPTNDSPPADLSWQQTLQRVWENLLHRGQSRIQGPNEFKMVYSTQEGKRDANQSSASCYESSLVLPSLPSAIRWIRESTQQNRAVRFQVDGSQQNYIEFEVLVTGSLHLVGDVLRLLKK